MNILKKLTAILKEAGVPMPEQAGDEHALKAYCDKLGAAMAAYGDGAGLAADHPLHALKALHKEMNDVMASATAKAAADKEATEKAAKPEEGDDVTKANIQTEVEKGLADIRKQLDAANERVAKAEAVSKADREAREVEVEKTTLRKFRHVTVDVDKDAPMFAKMRATDQPAYDFMIAQLNAAEAVAKKSGELERDLGSPMGGGNQTAWAEIEAEAAKIVAKGEKGLTIEKAIDQAMKNNPELVKRYKAETAGSPS